MSRTIGQNDLDEKNLDLIWHKRNPIHGLMADGGRNRMVDLPWQSTNKRRLEAVMFRDIVSGN